MKTRPAIGTRVRIGRSAGLSRTAHRKIGIVVAHHVDSIAIVVRLDPQKPLRPYFTIAQAFDLSTGLKFRRREGDWVVDYHDVTPEKQKRRSPLRRQAHKGGGR